MSRRGVLVGVALVACACALAAACRRDPPQQDSPPTAVAPAPDAGRGALPEPGDSVRAQLCVDAGAWRRFTTRAAGLSPSPLEAALRRLGATVAACPALVGTDDTVPLAALMERVTCLEGAPPPACARRGGADGVLLLEDGAKARAELTWRVDAQGDVRARFVGGAQPLAGVAAVHPSIHPAGQPVLRAQGPLLHARFRPSGGAEAFFTVPPGMQSLLPDRTASAALASAWLDGTWEVRVAPPVNVGSVPGVAVAVGTRSAALSRAAVTHLLEALRERYGLVEAPLPSRAAFRGRGGGCLPGLNVLPELSPCWVWSAEALAVAWNADVLEAALPVPAQDSAPTTADGLRVDFAAMMASDARQPKADGAAAVRIPWAMLRATPVAGQVGALDVELVGAAP